MKSRMLEHIKFRMACHRQRITTHGARRGAILLYHRVADAGSDPWRMSVSPANFSDHMSVLRRRGLARPLSEVAGALQEQGAPGGAVAVTFDDGYLDNLRNALPVLEREQVPGTVYVIGGAVGQPDAFWWDFLARVFLETPTLPETLTLTHEGAVTEWRLGRAAHASPSMLARLARWQADVEPARHPRQKVFLSVWEHIAARSPAGRRQAVAALADWSGVSPIPSEESGGRPVDPAELRQLAASPWIQIGGHTMTHPDLGQIASAQAAEEIAGCRRMLREATGQEISSFAYPFGRFSRDTADLIREAGFTNATCSRFGIATGQSPAFALPRIQVTDMSGRAFDKMLTALLGPGAAAAAAPRSLAPARSPA